MRQALDEGPAAFQAADVDFKFICRQPPRDVHHAILHPTRFEREDDVEDFKPAGHGGTSLLHLAAHQVERVADE